VDIEFVVNFNLTEIGYELKNRAGVEEICTEFGKNPV